MTGFAVLGGLAAWFVHICLMTALVGPACRHGGLALHLSTAVLSVVALAALRSSLRLRAASGGEVRPWLAEMAVLLNLFGLLLIGLEGAHILVLDACA